jgi:hypothetical protein
MLKNMSPPDGFLEFINSEYEINAEVYSFFPEHTKSMYIDLFEKSNNKGEGMTLPCMHTSTGIDD